MNNTKPIQYNDINLVINNYITELEKIFNTKKGAANMLIRRSNTHRPFLYVERIREVLLKKSNYLRNNPAEIKRFALAVKEWNDKKVVSADTDSLRENVSTKDAESIQRAAKLGFMLALDSSLPWVHAALH